MRSCRPLVGLTLGVLIFAESTGCALNSSIAVRHTGRRPESATSQRLLAIGEVFEKQGHLDRAASMYERVLSEDPSSFPARTAIARIESLKQPRNFRGRQPSESEIRVVSDMTESEVIIEPQTPVTVSEVPLVPPKPELEVASSTVSTAVRISTQGVDSIAASSERSSPANRLVSLEEVKYQTASIARAMTGPAISSDATIDGLLRVLNESNDSERRAVAAALLSDVSPVDSRVNSALEQHCLNDIDLVAAAACESLLARGFVSEQVIRTLLNLSDHSDAEIRSQIVVSLGQLAETPWEDDAVEASIVRLDDTSASVRGLAALTLSEFNSRSELILERLVERYDLETDENVRGLLELSAERIASMAN